MSDSPLAEFHAIPPGLPRLRSCTLAAISRRWSIDLADLRRAVASGALGCVFTDAATKRTWLARAEVRRAEAEGWLLVPPRVDAARRLP